MDTAVDIILFIVLLAVCLAGMILTVFQLPGTWLILVGAGAYAWHYDFERIGKYSLITSLVLATLAEVVETASGYVAGRRGGASRRAAWYGLVGGIAGAILLTIPVPIIGTIIGAAIGCFAAAVIAELQEGRGLQAGTRSGLYTALGRTFGSVLKVFASAAMSVIVVGAAVFGFFR